MTREAPIFLWKAPDNAFEFGPPPVLTGGLTPLDL
jgi:hypothetical protein